MNRTKLAVAVAMALSISGTAMAGPVTQTDVGGGTGNYSVDQFTANPGNILYNNIGVLDGGSHPTFDLLGQFSISAFSLGGSGGFAATAGGKEYTVVFSAPMIGNSNAGDPSAFPPFTALLDTANPQGYGNFFRIYFSSANRNNVAGTGFTDGTLILEGTFLATDPNAPQTAKTTAEINFTTSATTALLGSGNLSTTPTIKTTNTTAEFYVQVNTATLNSNFFPAKMNIIKFDFQLSGSQRDPYETGAGISSSFSEIVAGTTPNFGTDGVNNFACLSGTDGTNCDFLTELSAATVTYHATELPEPGSLALLGLGLGAAGAAGVRRRKRQAKTA